MTSIQLSELPFIPFQAKESLPECSAVYFLLSAIGEVEYIGRTINLNKRFIRHHRRTQFDSLKIAWIAVNKAELQAVETDAIELFNPRLNNTKSPDCTIYVRADSELIARLNRIAKAIDRPASLIVWEAIKKELEALSKRCRKSPIAS